jgi:hypothetical protein
MKGKRFLIGFAVLAMTVGGGAMASEIYKWTDEGGNVHYGDRPSDTHNEELMAMSYRRTDSNALQQRVQGQAEAMTARQEAKDAAAEEAKAAEAKANEAAQNQKKCESYRARLKTFVESRRLYRQDENGERVYLDEQQTQDARQRVEELIAEHCAS